MQLGASTVSQLRRIFNPIMTSENRPNLTVETLYEEKKTLTEPSVYQPFETTYPSRIKDQWQISKITEMNPKLLTCSSQATIPSLVSLRKTSENQELDRKLKLCLRQLATTTKSANST